MPVLIACEFYRDSREKNKNAIGFTRSKISFSALKGKNSEVKSPIWPNSNLTKILFLS